MLKYYIIMKEKSLEILNLVKVILLFCEDKWMKIGIMGKLMEFMVFFLLILCRLLNCYFSFYFSVKYFMILK